MPTINLRIGDVTSSVPVDAIATLVNSSELWFGGVDQAIKKVAGTKYHDALANQLKGKKVKSGDIFIAKGGDNHSVSFRDVIFAIDDLNIPLDTLVLNILVAAHDAGYIKVALPMLRTGVMLGVVEKTLRETVQRMSDGLRRFKDKYPDSQLDIFLVIYDDGMVGDLFAMLRKTAL